MKSNPVGKTFSAILPTRKAYKIPFSLYWRNDH